MLLSPREYVLGIESNDCATRKELMLDVRLPVDSRENSLFPTEYILRSTPEYGVRVLEFYSSTATHIMLHTSSTPSMSE
jgi:hypothetical protein